MRVLPHRLRPPAILGMILAVAAAAPAQQILIDGASCQIGASAGARRYRPGSWGVVEVSAANTSDKAADLFAVLHFAADPTLQYGRRICVPGKSVLRSTCPIRVPEVFTADSDYADLVTAEIGQDKGREALRRSPRRVLLDSKPILLDHEAPTVGLLGDFENAQPFADDSSYFLGPAKYCPAPDDPVYELVLAAKRAAGLSRRVSVFDSGELPADPAGLDVIDVLVLSTNCLASSPDGAALVRDWVMAGGHLWIMLDEVHAETVSAVLGDAFASAVIGRVGLTELRIKSDRPDRPVFETPVLELEEPVQLVRVIARGAVVTETVDGWPAAFRQPLGAGKVFFTTLGPAAWIRPATEGDPPPKTKGDRTAFVARAPLEALAGECLARQPGARVEIAAMEPFLTKQIGYRILSRNVVATVLAVFCAVVAVAGWGFSRLGRLEWLLWLAPLAAVATSLAFLGSAAAAKRAVPPTVASLQCVDLEPGVGTAHVSGLAAIYNPDLCTASMGASRGGTFFPDMTGLAGRRRRMVWTDQGAWHWEALELPPGVRTAPFTNLLSLEETVDCRARFGPNGLEGVLAPSPFASLSDAVIAVPNQPMAAARFHSDGSFTSESGDVLAPGEFITGAWLTDLQQRRNLLYQQRFRNRQLMPTDRRPRLFAWADVAGAGFTFPQPRQFGSALLSIPLRLEKPAPKSRITIPASFLPYRSVTGPDGRNSSSYSNLRHEWAEGKAAVIEWLRFQLPEAVLPFHVEQATLRLQVKAPSRSFEVLGVVDGQPVAVMTLSRPIGAYQAVLDRPAMLGLDEQGGWLMAVRVGNDESANRDPMAQAAWMIDSLQLEIVGTFPGE